MKKPIVLSLRAQRGNPEGLDTKMDCRVATAPRNDRGAEEYNALARMTPNQNGNALWFILIAIALLGILTITLSRSGSSSNDTGGFEQDQIAASEILTYAKSIENAVQSLLARGCSENEISFQNNVVADYTNPNSPSDKSCHVFDVAGAGMTYRSPNENWLDNTFSSNGQFGTINFSGAEVVLDAGTSRNDLVLHVNGVNFDICAQLNRQVNITNPTDDLPNEIVGGGIVSGSEPNRFKGEFATSFTDPIGNATGDYLRGKTSGCMKRTDASNMPQFFHVLHAR